MAELLAVGYGMRAALVVIPLVMTSCASEPLPVASPTRTSSPVAIGPNADKIDASTIVGKPMPPFEFDWMDRPPITPDALHGRVVLVRWFTEGCPYCEGTAPSLVSFHDEFGDRGLQVIGIYHHKTDDPLEVPKVKQLIDNFRFKFPVAIDRDWKTLRAWWLDHHPGWTSLSFLIDRRGVVRFVHTGGSYAPGSTDAAQMRRWIEQLISET